MQSDPRIQLALQAVAASWRAFEASLDATIEEVRGFLASRHGGAAERAERMAEEFGEFAAGRVDAAALARLFEAHDATQKGDTDAAEAALRTLLALRSQEEKLYLVGARSSRDLFEAVDRALARIGRAFGAARVVAAVRRGGPPPDEHARMLAAFPYSRWNRAERRQAPPIVVEVDGYALRPAGLAEFLDGRQKIVLVVRGACPPAALVRLIGPRQFVAQSVDAAVLERLLAWDGPGAVALVPDGAAQFTYDPGSGAAVWERLKIGAAPAARPARPLAGLSVAQQAEDLELLEILAATPSTGRREPPAADSGTSHRSDPVAALAGWLLEQGELSQAP